MQYYNSVKSCHVLYCSIGSNVKKEEKSESKQKAFIRRCSEFLVRLNAWNIIEVLQFLSIDMLGSGFETNLQHLLLVPDQ